MQKHILIKSLTHHPFGKNALLLCGVLALVACGGGGGDSGTSNNTINQAPSNVALNTVVALNANTIDIAWNLAKDDKTIPSTMRYQVHLSESANFSPSTITLKFEQRGGLATQLTGLKASTTYFVKLVVIDEDNARTVSAEKSVTTPAVAVTNQAPTNVLLDSVTAVSPTAVDVAWTAANDDTTPANQLTYEVHLAEGGDFSPSATTLKFSGKNVLSAQLTGLKAHTDYSVKLVVMDTQNIRTISVGKSVQTLSYTLQDTGLLNDTGLTQCANQNNVMNNCDSAYLGEWFNYSQDAQVGRDALAAKGLLVKLGGGDAGFDFTKISATGQKLPASASVWSCVLDNHTGLMWENKTDDGGLRDKDNIYSWYNPDLSSNGGNSGDLNNNNNSYIFTKNINIQGLCGNKNWRLPSVVELESIINYNNTRSNPAIDSAYFLYATIDDVYWSSTSEAFHGDDAWVCALSNYSTMYNHESKLSKRYKVRLVRNN